MRTALITPGSRSKTPLAVWTFRPDLVVKHVGSVELRVVVAAVPAVAADAVLVAQQLLKIATHLVTALTRLHVCNLAQKEQTGGGENGGEKRRGGAEKRKKPRVVVWHGKQEMPVECARVSRTDKYRLFYHPYLSSYGRCKERWVWAGAVILSSTTFSL
jgi:hypothetical protein